MKTSTLFVVALVMAGTVPARADAIRLADGSVIEGQLGVPCDVTIKTAGGDKKVAFTLLPPELQKIYWQNSANANAAPPVAAGLLVADEEMAALANDVNLQTWSLVTAIGSFRDKAEKRGPGGLIVTKAFNALDENWVTVYSPKDAVGQAGDWNEPLARARALEQRTEQFMQQRWLQLFIRAGEAVARRDSNDFAQAVRELKRNPISLAASSSNPQSQNFFTAK